MPKLESPECQHGLLRHIRVLPGSSRSTNRCVELWTQGPLFRLWLPTAVPDKLLKEILATQIFLFPEMTLLSLLYLIIVWLITSTDKGTDIKGGQGGDKQAVRKWLRVGGAKGRTKLPGGEERGPRSVHWGGALYVVFSRCVLCGL